MIMVPYFVEEIGIIFKNTAPITLILEASLVAFIMWLILYKRSSGRIKYSKKQEDEIINDYKSEPLVFDTDPQHPFLQPHIVESKVDKRFIVDGYDCLNLATHNYLGLIDNRILESACNSIQKYGVGSCGPRGFYGTMDVHLELEDRLAKFMHMEEAVVYSYGFSTVASAIPAYAKRGDTIFVDGAVNFAIQKGLDASRSTINFFKHNDMADLEKLLIKQEKQDMKNKKKAANTRRFLIVEGIYLNTGEICPLPELVELCTKFKLRLFIDESISFGVLGSTGHGITEHFNIDRSKIDLICVSMEGAVSSIGGFCVGSHFIVEHQRLSGLGYCFSASLPPLLAQAAISALDIFEEEPKLFKELQQILEVLHTKFQKFTKLQIKGDIISPIKHLYLRESYDCHDTERKLISEISNECVKRGIAIVDSRYLPMEKHTFRPSIRIVGNRLLTKKDIDIAYKVIEDTANEILK